MRAPLIWTVLVHSPVGVARSARWVKSAGDVDIDIESSRKMAHDVESLTESAEDHAAEMQQKIAAPRNEIQSHGTQLPC